MRLVFAGTPDVAVPSLDALVASPHEVVAVITRPDAPSGRGRRMEASPVKQRALELGLPVLEPESARDPQFHDALRELEPDACPVVAYGNIIPPKALAIPRLGWVNLHFSLLPAWRGAAPVQRAIIAGDEITGATTFLLERDMDTGPVLGLMTERILPGDTAGDLLGRLAEAGAGLLVATMDGLAGGALEPRPQPAEGVSLAPKIEVDDAHVSWQSPAQHIDRLVRGCTPAPGAWTTFRGERFKLHPLEVVTAEQLPSGPEGTLAAPAPGELVVTKRAVFVGTATSPVRLGTVQAHGKKPMAAADWARGVRVEAGERLGDEGVGQEQDHG